MFKSIIMLSVIVVVIVLIAYAYGFYVSGPRKIRERTPNPMLLSGPSKETYDIARRSVRLLDQLIQQDDTLPVFRNDQDREEAKHLTARFYGDD